MMKFIKRLFCKHKGKLTFIRNIYGDEIMHSNYNRSVWSCDECYWIVLKPELNDPEPGSNK